MLSGGRLYYSRPTRNGVVLPRATKQWLCVFRRVPREKMCDRYVSDGDYHLSRYGLQPLEQLQPCNPLIR